MAPGLLSIFLAQPETSLFGEEVASQQWAHHRRSGARGRAG